MRPSFLLICIIILSRYNSNSQVIGGTHSLREAGFRENLGQVRDQHDHPNRSVKYIFSDLKFNLQLKQNSFSYQLAEVENKYDLPESDLASGAEPEDLFDFQRPVLHTHRVDVTLPGANPEPEIITGDATEAYFNYYINLKTDQPVLNVKGYKKVMYKNIYENIDLVFSSPDEDNGEPLKYEWIIHPGGDPDKIRLSYKGATGMVIADNGQLELMTSRGIVTEASPVCFFADNDAVAIASAYSLNGNELRYNISNYDRSRTLIIDPTLMWGTYFGGEKEETVFESEITLDNFNKVLITGSTQSENDIATTGAFDNDYDKLTDIFLAKFKNTGKIEWATYFGGKGKDGSYAVSVDGNTNEIIIAGSSSSATGMATPGAFKDTLTGTAGDMLISKFSSAGSLIWSTYYGGEDREHIRNVLVSSNGNLFWGGYTASTTGIATPGAYDITYGGEGDGALGEFTKDGWPVWVSYFSGTKNDRIHVMSFDTTEGYFFAGGTCESKNGFIINSPFQKKIGGNIDAFMSYWDTTGNYYWGTYIGGNKDDRGRGVVLDNSGYVYFGGFTESDDSISSPGAHQPNWSEGYTNDSLRTDDGYLMKFTHDGQYLWGTYYGGPGTEWLRGLAIDDEANLYFIGESQSFVNIATPNGFQPVKNVNSNSDGYVAKFDSAGNRVWGTYLGSAGVDEGNDVTVDNKDFVYATVETRGNIVAMTPGVHQTVNKGLEDVTIFKLHTGSECFDNFEPNQDNLTAKKLDAFHETDVNIYGWSATISGSADQDWFKIQANLAEPHYKIVLDHLTEPYNLNFLNKQGVQMYYTVDTTTNTKTIIANNLGQSKYYIQILHGPFQFDPLNCYRLRIYKSATPFPAKEGAFHVTNAEEDLTIYPNPVGDQLTLSMVSAHEDEADLLIFDILNRQVHGSKVLLHDGIQEIDVDVSDLVRGPYQVVIKNTEKFWVGSFVKQ